MSNPSKLQSTIRPDGSVVLTTELIHDARLAREMLLVVREQFEAIKAMDQAIQRLREHAPEKACLADRIAQLKGQNALRAAAPFLED